MPENIDDFLGGGGGNIPYPIKKGARAENEVELAGELFSVFLDNPVKIDDFVIQVVDDFARSPFLPCEVNRTAAEKRLDVSADVSRNHRHNPRPQSLFPADIRE